MAYSIQLYTGDGSQTIYTFAFDYLLKSHVLVNVDGVDTSFTFLSSNTITISPAPADNAVIEVYRSTPKTRLVDFLNGSVQDAEDFDLDSDQLLYLVLEGLDESTKSLSRIPVSRDNGMHQDIDLNGLYKIINSAAPVSPTDLVRLQDLPTNSITVDVASLQSDIDAAVASIVALAIDVAVNSTNVADNASDIYANVTDISSNAASAALNAANITAQGSAIASLVAADAALQAILATNATAIANNATSVATNATDVATNAANVAANTADIVSLQSNFTAIGDVKESHAILSADWIPLNNQAVSSATYPDLKATAGIDKVDYISSSYTYSSSGIPGSFNAVASTTSYNLVASTSGFYHEDKAAPGTWVASSMNGETVGASYFYNIVTRNDNVAVTHNSSNRAVFSTDGGVTFNVSNTVLPGVLSEFFFVGDILCATVTSGGFQLYCSTDFGLNFSHVEELVSDMHGPGIIGDKGFVFLKFDMIVTYRLTVTGGEVRASMSQVYTVAIPENSNAVGHTYNEERNQLVVVLDEITYNDSVGLMTIDLVSGAIETYHGYFDSAVNVGHIQAHWVGGDSYAVTCNEGISFIELTDAARVQAIVSNFSTIGDNFIGSHVHINRETKQVTVGRSNISYGKYVDVFHPEVSTTAFLVPHNPTTVLGSPRYIKAL